MKSYKFFLPLLAVLLLFGASSALADALDETRHVTNSGGNPVWANHAGMIMGDGNSITVINDAGYGITFEFLNNTGGSLGAFNVGIAGSVTQAVPFSESNLALNTDRVAVYKTSPVGPQDFLKVYIGIGIPTLSEWSMIIFSVLLLGLMTYSVIKRRRVAHSLSV